MRKIVGLTVIVLALTIPANAVEDTPENRMIHAKRYLEVTDTQKMMGELASQIAASIPAEHRDQVIRAISEDLDLEALEQIMLDSMVEVFTTDELAALADFWGSPAGKSAMEKMPVYMGHAWPKLQTMMAEAVQRATSEQGSE